MLVAFLELMSHCAIPLLVIGIPILAHFRGIDVFASFIRGAEEGLKTAIRIIPHLVAMLVAIELFKLSGVLDILLEILKPALGWAGIPPAVLPLAIIRPLSGSAAFGFTVDLINTPGPDSFIGRLSSTMQGSTDTTFYILTVYFGSVGIKKVRHALIVGIIGDIAGFLAAVYICQSIFGRG